MLASWFPQITVDDTMYLQQVLFVERIFVTSAMLNILNDIKPCVLYLAIRHSS